MTDIRDENGILDVSLYRNDKPTPMRAIRHFCVICMGGNPASPGSAKQLVIDCASTYCPFHHLRPWNPDRPKRQVSEAQRKNAERLQELRKQSR